MVKVCEQDQDFAFMLIASLKKVGCTSYLLAILETKKEIFGERTYYTNNLIFRI